MRGVVLLIAALLVSIVACSPTPPDTSGSQPFPDVDRTALSAGRLRVVDLLREQVEHPQPGTFYSEGVDEPWCADFVSWVMNEAGQPFVNPNSGYWRIPGVYTLQEYFASVGRFEPAGYHPQPGDVVLYDEPSELGLHANVVVAVNGSTLTTVGGNQPGGITVRTFETGPDAALLGFGRLA